MVILLILAINCSAQTEIKPATTSSFTTETNFIDLEDLEDQLDSIDVLFESLIILTTEINFRLPRCSRSTSNLINK